MKKKGSQKHRVEPAPLRADKRIMNILTIVFIIIKIQAIPRHPPVAVWTMMTMEATGADAGRVDMATAAISQCHVVVTTETNIAQTRAIS